jgi:intracellular sulfur oxidation DsrE/DsrF family protein
MKLFKKVVPVAALLVAGMSASAQAQDSQCLMIHVPQEDAKAFKQAINIANNIPKQLGADAVRIEVIAQGPGLKLFTKGSPETDRIKSLAAMGDQTMGGGTKFSACEATIKGIEKRTGKAPELIEGVGVTSPGAVARILELHKEGCAYIRI